MAICGDGADAKTGWLDAAGGSAFMSPGMKKVAGETVPLALTPEQPVLNKTSASSIASSKKFQFNLTRPV